MRIVILVCLCLSATLVSGCPDMVPPHYYNDKPKVVNLALDTSAKTPVAKVWFEPYEAIVSIEGSLWQKDDPENIHRKIVFEPINGYIRGRNDFQMVACETPDGNIAIPPADQTVFFISVTVKVANGLAPFTGGWLYQDGKFQPAEQ